MLIKLTSKAERGIGLRSRSTGKLRRYEAGDELEVADSVAVGLINSNLAEQVVRQLDNGETIAESAELDNGETIAESAELDNGETIAESAELDNGETVAESAELDNGETTAESAEPDNGETTIENAELDNGETTAESAEQDNEDYASMTVKELREVLKKQGKPTDGTKEELLKRLKEN